MIGHALYGALLAALTMTIDRYPNRPFPSGAWALVAFLAVAYLLLR